MAHVGQNGDSLASTHRDDNQFIQTALFSLKLSVPASQCRDALAELGSMCFNTKGVKCSAVPTGCAGDELIVFSTESGSFAVLRVPAASNHATLDVNYVVPSIVPDGRHNTVNQEFIRALSAKLEHRLGSLCTKCERLLVPVNRGQEVFRYFASGGDCLIETDYDRLLCDIDSPFQNIKIFHSPLVGNVLHLDEDVMYGESDKATYIDCLLGIDSEPREDYSSKEVLILGGGDGGLLYNLIQKGVKMATMVEIDEAVVRACRTHMRRVCGDALDKYEGERHRIIFDDCVNILKKRVAEGFEYDYVVNDLTEFPVSKEDLGSFDFDLETTSLILELSLKCIKKGGKYLARGNCIGSTDYLESCESDMKRLNGSFVRRERYVPSFREMYVMYEVEKC